VKIREKRNRGVSSSNTKYRKNIRNGIRWRGEGGGAKKKWCSMAYSGGLGETVIKGLEKKKKRLKRSGGQYIWKKKKKGKE